MQEDHCGSRAEEDAYQGWRKLPKSGAAALLDQSCDAVDIDIEVCKDDNSAQSTGKFFRLHFQLSGWALVALSYFED